MLKRHRTLVWRLCWHYAGGDWERCRDLVQEVAIDLWEYYGSLRAGAHPLEERTWVVLHTRRTLHHLHRRKAPQYQPLTPGMTDSLVADDGSEREAAEELTASLQEPDSTIVRLRLEGYSAAEIAARTGLGPNAVYQRLHRIVKRLREQNGYEKQG